MVPGLQPIQRHYIHQVKPVLCIRFIILILVLNEARDGAQQVAGGRKFHRMGAVWGKALSPSVLSLVLGTRSRLLCQERKAWPGWYHCSKLEIMWRKAVQGSVCEDQDHVVHTGRHRKPDSAAPSTQVSYVQTWV